MSTDKVTPIPQVKGTPKRMRPRVLRISYYLIALVGLFHVLAGLYLSYTTEILSTIAPSLTVQPSVLGAIIEFFSGIFAIVAAFGLRRLVYWGVSSGIVFGAFEIWNGSLLSQVVQFALSASLNISFSNTYTNSLAFVFAALGILIIVLSAFSVFGIRRHRRVAGMMKG